MSDPRELSAAELSNIRRVLGGYHQLGDRDGLDLLHHIDYLTERVAVLETVRDAAWCVVKGRYTTFGYQFHGAEHTLDEAIRASRKGTP